MSEATCWVDVLVARRKAKCLSSSYVHCSGNHAGKEAMYGDLYGGRVAPVAMQESLNAGPFVNKFIQTIRRTYPRLQFATNEAIAMEILRRLDAA